MVNPIPDQKKLTSFVKSSCDDKVYINDDSMSMISPFFGVINVFVLFLLMYLHCLTNWGIWTTEKQFVKLYLDNVPRIHNFVLTS